MYEFVINSPKVISFIPKPASSFLGCAVACECIFRRMNVKDKNNRYRKTERKIMWLGVFVFLSELIDVFAGHFFANLIQNCDNVLIPKLMVWFERFSILLFNTMLISILSVSKKFTHDENTRQFISFFDFSELYSVVFSMASTVPIFIVDCGYSEEAGKFIMLMNPKGRILSDFITADVWILLSVFICYYCLSVASKYHQSADYPLAYSCDLEKDTKSSLESGLSTNHFNNSNSSEPMQCYKKIMPWIVTIIAVCALPIGVKYCDYFGMKNNAIEIFRLISLLFGGMKGLFCIIAAEYFL